MNDSEEFRLLWEAHLRGASEAGGRGGDALTREERLLVEEMARGLVTGERLKEATDLVYLKPEAMELLAHLVATARGRARRGTGCGGVRSRRVP